MTLPDSSGGSSSDDADRKRRTRRASRRRRRPSGGGGSGDDRRQPGSVGRGNPETGSFWWLPGATVSQAYGNRNSMYEHGYHDGIDLSVPTGTKVAALTSGTVVYAGNAGADGYRVGIRMPNGKVYYYGHLSKINVSVGQQVQRGQVVAQSGNTGRSYGAHVHFELDRDTNGVGDSPVKFLERWGGGTIRDGEAKGGKSGPDTASYPTSGKGAGYADSNQTADYGWSEAVFNSNPELKKLLQKAKANDWDAQTMQAAIRGTDWYRQHSASWRENWVLKRDNPEEFEQRRRTARTQVDAIANQWGIDLSEQQRNKIARDMMFLGLSEEEVVSAIGGVGALQGGDLAGSAGDIQDNVMKLAADYGVRVSDSFITGLVRGIMAGTMTEQDADNHIKGLAKSTYASLAPQIDAGMTVAEIANPYIRSMATLLELNDADIDLFDPTIRAALTGRTQDGTPAVKPIWQFENEVRSDSRWLNTNNARDSLDGVGNSILKMWGLVS
jgi:murein DD-endopeptidase MepM/ murein hydrolase activator NlpD